MGEVVSYRNEPGRAVFCQIRLDSGERVLISVANMEVKIQQQRQGGRLPASVMWTCNDPGRLLVLFGDPANPGKHPLDAMRDKILTLASVQDLERFLAGHEGAREEA